MKGQLQDPRERELEAILRAKVCGICSDRTEAGECGREAPETCALFRLFPQVVRAIQSTSSDDIRDYVDAIRKQVCSVCESEMTDHTCEDRAQVRCALDAYLMVVVDTIEEATGKQFDRAVLAQPPAVTVQWDAAR
jgi:hypothetical protein